MNGIAFRFLITIFISGLFIFQSNGQYNPDSLEQVMVKAPDQKKVQILYYLSNYFIDKSPAKTIELANQLLKIGDNLDSLSYKAIAYSFLGEAYYFLDNLSKAEEYFLKHLDANIKLDDKNGIGAGYNNLGVLHRNNGDYEKAIDYYKQSTLIYEETNNLDGISSNYNNIGVLYEELNLYRQALEYYILSYELEIELEDLDGISTSLLNIGALKGLMGNQQEGIDYCLESLEICDSLGFLITKEMNHEHLSKMYKAISDFPNALDHYEKHTSLRNIRINEESQQSLAELEIKYELEKHEEEIEFLNNKNKLRKIINYLLIALSFVIFSIGFFIARESKKRKQRNNALIEHNQEILQHKEEIEAQRDEIEAQKDEIQRQKIISDFQKEQISKQNTDITDSIEYARNIQIALFPDKIMQHKVLGDGFCLFLPRDIVSGDFYWFAEQEGKKIIAAADCTGHGVPGAFMSIIGINFLNEILVLDQVLDPAEILNKLRKKIVKSLVHSNKSSETKDGMDIALCVIDEKERKIEYSGAYNNLYIVKDKLLEVYKADRMPVGLSFKEMLPYTRHTIQYKPGDTIYMFSDGFADQFGGPNRKKFRISQLRDFLLEIHEQPMQEQHKLLYRKFLNWKGDQIQVDDVLLLGKKLS